MTDDSGIDPTGAPPPGPDPATDGAADPAVPAVPDVPAEAAAGQDTAADAAAGQGPAAETAAGEGAAAQPAAETPAQYPQEVVEVDRAADEPALIVDVEGFEGPLDLLLALARQQKVDLHKISILALAEQYLAFVEEARRLRLELAADYLVMAAWLAYLKSRLLLPAGSEPEGVSATDMAAALALRLKRLEAIRDAAAKLMSRPQLGREVFGRGDPEPIEEIKRPEWSATLYDLLSAYASQRQRQALAHVRMKKRNVWSLAEARSILQRLLGTVASEEWSVLDGFLVSYAVEPSMRPTVYASSLAALLELVREGVMDVHQPTAFAPIYVRKHTTVPDDSPLPPSAASEPVQ
ncbi:ScpA family protein [Rhodoplanes sp. TEM]|uniref:Segregation and condensation protein A n=1 Tax=Rhodoplanes tepidamans TaxID=200616 RepID=A0ABT5JK65_RHOTP|nr:MULTISPECIES: ScpA family protein [Rhodoplanes]MDC7789878.1 ScpA family protein [Rhodoplanes tepidamans]MDC7985025.1 ScpA family protein [Rhodoplanes sp. TEM]MDQ0355318.1 segregation and condensation protein A [Rhodoplanes tepidamans]